MCGVTCKFNILAKICLFAAIRYVGFNEIPSDLILSVYIYRSN